MMMKMMLVMLMLLVPVLGGYSSVNAADYDDVPLRVNKIVVTGFKLHDQSVYKAIQRENRSKRLTPAQIDEVVDKLLAAYRAAGYVGLVEATHTLRKGVLTVHITLSKQ